MAKRLFYFLYISPDFETNIAVATHRIMLKKYISIFDELNFIVAVDNIDDYKTDDERANAWLKDICGEKDYNIRFVENSNMRESRVVLENIIPMINDGIEDEIFLAHLKGITDVNMGIRNKYSILRWIISMYYYSLEYVDEATEKLKTHGFFGSLLTEFKGFCNDDKMVRNHKTFYIGSFYWLKPSILKGNIISENLDALKDSRFLQENFPLCFDRKYLSSHDNRFTPSSIVDLYYLPKERWPMYLSFYGDSDILFKVQNETIKEVCKEENSNMKKCIIVVPVYKEFEKWTRDEMQSHDQLIRILGTHDICYVAPNGLKVPDGARAEYFPKDFFKSRLDYGQLMNDASFYARFSDYEYMLVYQTDCWVFRDELNEWCDKGYDYIGAPFFVKWFSDRGLFVGNGGFSLRKISSMISYIKKYGNPGVPHFGTDDGFFAANYERSLNIPAPEIAATFSLEVSPEPQYKRTGKLPFGCHAYKRYDWKFWSKFIEYDPYWELKKNVTFAILNYGNDDNAARWYRTFKDYFDTYIIDTKCLDNNLPNPFEKEFGGDSHILLEHNVYNGGQRIIAYNKMVEGGRKWMMTVDADIEIRDEASVNALLYSVDKVINSTDIGVYEPSAIPGSKCMGSTNLIPDNLHLFKQGSNGFRVVEGGEGWFRLVKKDIADRIYPFQNFEDNKYGWGGEAHYYLAKQMGLKTVIDDTVSFFHPAGVSYDNKEAVLERAKFMARFPELGIETPKYKTADEIKTLICCIGKNENRYVRHYVEWYKNLGVTHICLYDNNDPDGERFEDVIGDYVNDGFVEIIDVRGQKVVQLKCYTECYATHKNDYDWILFIDCGDEYLSFPRNIKIGQYLSMPQFRNYDMIHVNLMTFGDNDKTEVTDAPLWERFPEPIPFDKKVAYDFPEDMHVSSIVRGGLEDIKWEGKGFTHTPSPNSLRCCNNVGFTVDSESPFAPVDFQFAAFRHYTTKTAKEYCEKMRRGFPDQLWDGSRVKNLIETRFFRTNAVTKEKVQIFKDELGIDMSYLLPKEEAVVDKSDDVKIYSLCYTQKNFDFLNDFVITPLQVGAANGTDVCRTKDNTGDNISDQNYFYIENTGTYWIWKNVHSKIKGQMQYRRPLSGIDEKFDFDKAFESYDVITCAPFHHPDHKVPTAEEQMVIPADTVEQGYGFSNCIDDLYVLEMVIKMYFPEYAEDYDKYIKNGPDLYYSNGFIMKSEDFDRYCEFLFKCLDGYRAFANIKTEKQLEEHVRYNLEVGKYPRYQDPKKVAPGAIKWQMSIGGFLSERIWTLWVQHNFPNERILKLPYIKQEEGMYT